MVPAPRHPDLGLEPPARDQATVLAGAAAPLLGTEMLRVTNSSIPVVIMLLGGLLLTVVGMLAAPETRHSA
jgi:hypothetical protein